MTPNVFICGGDESPGPRGTDCPNAVHDHPLPSGYSDAAFVAGQRLQNGTGWRNSRCPECRLYGWTFDAAKVYPRRGVPNVEPDPSESPVLPSGGQL